MMAGCGILCQKAGEGEAKMSDTNKSWVDFIVAGGVVHLILFFIFWIIFPDLELFLLFLGCIFWTIILTCLGPPISPTFLIFLAIDAFRDRSENTFKKGHVSNDGTLDIYSPTLKQLDNVTPIYTIEEVGKYAECPYCGSNMRETFNELGGVVRCDKCYAFHHKECFEYYGKICGSSSCKLGEA
jgi:hypothetical protein